MTKLYDARTVTGRRACRFGMTLVAAALAACGCGGSPVDSGRAGRFDPDSMPEAYAQSTAALMWPGATRAFQVTPAGDLYNGEWLARIRAFAGFDSACAPRTIAYEDRWCPIAHWRRMSGTVIWSFAALALPEPAPRDSGLLVSLEVQARNTGTAESEARFEVSLEPPRSPAFVAFDAPESLAAALRWGSTAAADTVNAWSPAPAQGAVLRQSWRLAPGASRVARLVLPAYPTPARTLAAFARRSHARRAGEVRRYWESELARGARFALNDPEVEDAVRAGLVTMLSLRERRGSAWVPIGNPFQYRDVWLRDGARVVRALAVTGHTRVARELAAGFEGLQWPQGPFLSQRGQLDGTGQALWAFEQAFLRPAPDDSIGRYAADAERAWRWFEWQRDMGRQSGWEFGTMLPYGDPRDGELVRAQLVGNDAWAIAGYRATARLLAAAGRAADARAVEASRSLYLGDFLQALRRTGRSDVPPSWQGVGRDWGNIAVVHPCGVLPARDARVAALAARIWTAGGGAGLCSYGTSDTLQYYVGADLGTWAMLAGRRAAADSVLDAMLHWRTASGVGAELFSRASRHFGFNLPPHGTSAAALVSLVRDALVFDDDDTLRLTLGARARWWTNGRAEHVATRWGFVDLAFHRAGSSAEWKWSPVPVWTALTLPPGTRLAGALSPPLVRSASEDVVLAPPRATAARVGLVGR